MKANKNDWLWFVLVSLLYLSWVIWLKNFWFLAGLIVIFDLYISKIVNWTFWKRRDGHNSRLIEWLDAIIFAIIAVTIINIFIFQNYKIPTPSMEKTLMVGDYLFVSKMAYGPRLPNTPLTVPFTQNTLPLTRGTKSYLEWIRRPYKRLTGFGRVKRDDAVVFNFPAGDTVVVEYQNVTYYSIVRDSAELMKQKDKDRGFQVKSDAEYYNLARRSVWNGFDIVTRPVDKRDNYVKRCVAIPGDTLQIINGRVYINGQPQKEYPGIQYNYLILLKEGQDIPERVFNRMGIYDNERSGNIISTYLTREELTRIKSFKSVQQVGENGFFDKYYSRLLS